MNTKLKTLARTAAVLLAAGSGAAVALRQNEISSLRAEQQSLVNDRQEAERLARENQDIEKLRAENAEVTKLRLENKDLPKLRNEVRQLRKQLDEMAKLRAENQRLSAQPGDSPIQIRRNIIQMEVTKESLQDKGLGLPILTLQTYFAAMFSGNLPRAMECLTPEATARFQAVPEEAMRQQILKDSSGFIGYQITDRNQPSPDEIVLEIKLSSTGGTQQIHFKQVGNEWKIAP